MDEIIEGARCEARIKEIMEIFRYEMARLTFYSSTDEDCDLSKYGEDAKRMYFALNDAIDILSKVRERMMTDKETEFTLDELKTIRIHMGAIKEKLCNQRRWGEAIEYQIIQDKLEPIIKEAEKGKKNEKRCNY